jgi:hypothetical protein
MSEPRSVSSNQRLRTLRKTIEHYARTERDRASSETVAELNEVANLLQEMESAAETTDHTELLKKIPRVGQQFVDEIKTLSRQALEQRVLIQKDWCESYAHCLDGLINSGVDYMGCLPKDIRRHFERLNGKSSPEETTENRESRLPAGEQEANRPVPNAFGEVPGETDLSHLDAGVSEEYAEHDRSNHLADSQHRSGAVQVCAADLATSEVKASDGPTGQIVQPVPTKATLDRPETGGAATPDGCCEICGGKDGEHKQGCVDGDSVL